MTQRFVNNFATTVAQTFGPTDTYLRVASPIGLPVLGAGDYLLLTVFRKAGLEESGHEVVKVTSITADLLTVERSVEGAAPTTFLTGDRVECRLTALSLDSFTDEAQAAAAAPVQSVAGKTGDVALVKADVGLANVDNTSDVNKPVSLAQQSALNLKANLASPAFTGTPTGITKSHVGLGNVDNTSDANKPISTATQTALNLKANLANPTFTGTVGGITKVMVGLANVDNTSDLSKPISTATQTALSGKSDTGHTHGVASNAVAGFMSSADKTKLDGIASGATNYIHPANHPASIITQDANNRFVTDAEKNAWNSKQDSLVSGTTIKTVNGSAILGSGDLSVSGYSVGDIRQTYEYLQTPTSPSKLANLGTFFGSASSNYCTLANGILFLLRRYVALDYIEGETLKTTNGSLPYYMWASVTYGANKYVAVGYDTSTNQGTKFIYSSDASNWTQVTVPTGYWTNVVYTGTAFLAFSRSPAQFIKSVDGVTWDSPVATHGFRKVKYLNNRLVAFGYPNEIYESTDDGVNWTLKAAPTFNSVNDNAYNIEYLNGNYLASVVTGATLFSPDLVNWTNTGKKNSSASGTHIVFDGKHYVTFTNQNTIDYSSDLVTWKTAEYTNVLSDYALIPKSQNNFYAYSTSGVSNAFVGDDPNWVPPTWLECEGGVVLSTTYPSLVGKTKYSPKTPEFVSLYSVNGVKSSVCLGHLGYLFCSGDSTAFYTSRDGVNWTGKYGRPSGRTAKAVYGNGIYVVAYDYLATTYASTDLVTWTQLPSTFKNTYLAYGNGLFVAEDGLNVVTSSDLVNWTSTAIPASNLQGINFVNNRWFIWYLNSRNVYTSLDGISWQMVTLPYYVTYISYIAGMYVDLGYSTAYATSLDGINWGARTRAQNVNSAVERNSVITGGDILIFRTDSGYAYTFDGLSWYTGAEFFTASYVRDKVFCGMGTALKSVEYGDTTKLVLPKIERKNGVKSFIKVNP